MSVEVENRTREPIALVDVEAVAAAVLDACGAPAAEASVLLVGPDEMRGLNRRWRQRDEVTDVLAFPIDGDDEVPEGLPRMLGDVVVCPARCREQALEAGVAPGRELSTLVVHGVLHLLGYDHEVDDGAMLRRQDELLAALPDVGWQG